MYRAFSYGAAGRISLLLEKCWKLRTEVVWWTKKVAQRTINGLFVERAWRPGLRHSQNIIFKKKRKVLVDGRAGYKSRFKRLPVITNGSPSFLRVNQSETR